MTDEIFHPVRQGAVDISALIDAVLRAGRQIMQMRENVATEWKADKSPVTEADRQAEAILLAALDEHYPDIQVISEENSESHKKKPEAIYFLVDPLDGTNAFIRPQSRGEFTVNIGLIMDGQAVGGIIYAPIFDWLCWASLDDGAYQYRNKQMKQLHIEPNDIAELRALTSHAHLDQRTNRFLQDNDIINRQNMGSSLKFLLLANGEANIYPRFAPTMEWDTAAGEAILRAAGGMVFTETGTPHYYGKKNWYNHAFIACAGIQPKRLIFPHK